MPEKRQDKKYPAPSRVSNLCSGSLRDAVRLLPSWTVRSILAAASGLLLAVSFPPYDFYPLAWTGLVPLLEAIRRAPTPRAAWSTGTLAFLILYVGAGWWGWNHYHLQPALAASAPLLVMPILLGAPCGAAVLLRRRLGSAAAVTGLLAGITAVEWSLFQGPWALPWLIIGHSQANAFPFNQLADPFGPLGLSVWVWTVNIALWTGVTRTVDVSSGGSLPADRPGGRRPVGRGTAQRWGGGRWSWPPLLAAFLLVAGVYGYGARQLNRYGPARSQAASVDASRSLELLLVQPGLTAPAWSELEARRVERLRTLTDSFLEAPSASEARPDLVLWPEAALPEEASTPGDSARSALRAWSRSKGIPLLTGAILTVRRAEPPVPERDGLLNSALLLGASGGPQRYDKRRLVPFAEQVPGARWWPRLQHLALDGDPSERNGSGAYRTGRTDPVLQIGDWTVGLMICFESVFAGPARRAVSAGADVLVVLAQSGWWGRTPGFEQHFSFSRLRAIQTRRPLAMVTVNGRSGWIRPDGRTAGQLGWMERGGLRVSWTPSARSAQVAIHPHPESPRPPYPSRPRTPGPETRAE